MAGPFNLITLITVGIIAAAFSSTTIAQSTSPSETPSTSEPSIAASSTSETSSSELPITTSTSPTEPSNATETSSHEPSITTSTSTTTETSTHEPSPSTETSTPEPPTTTETSTPEPPTTTETSTPEPPTTTSTSTTEHLITTSTSTLKPPTNNTTITTHSTTNTTFAPTTESDTSTASTTTTTTTTTSTTTSPPTPKPIEICKGGNPFPDLYPDYSWEAATAGTNTSKKCPNGTDTKNNNATRLCGHDGEWIGLPDLSNCRTLDLSGFEDELNDPNSNTTAGDTLAKLASNITGAISPGDVISVVNIIDVAKERHKRDLMNVTATEEVKNVTNKYTDSVTNISSTILEKPTVWDGLPKTSRFETGSQLQETVKEAAVEVAVLLNEERKFFNHSALRVLAKQYSSSHYDLEENRIFIHPEHPFSQVTLPSGFYENLLNKSRVAVTFTAYKTLHCVMSGGAVCNNRTVKVNDSEFIVNDLVNAPVLGLTVGNSSWSASNNSNSKVIVNFSHLYSKDKFNLTATRCVWWDSINKSWSREGCETILNGSTSTDCACDHLTNLAVIMDVHGTVPPHIREIILYITIIGCSISLPCLLLAILTLGRFLLRNKRIRNTTKHNALIDINLCCCLFVTEIVLLGGLDKRQNSDVGCSIIAGILHYLLLVTFCWMGVESANLYTLLIKVFSSGRSPMKLYFAFAYGCPAIIVAISALATQGDGYGNRTDNYCWLDYETGLTWAFVGPALAILIANLVVFILCVRAVRDQIESSVQRGTRVGGGKTREEEEFRKWDREDKKKMLQSTFFILTTIGVTWLLSFTIMFQGLQGLAIFFTIINSLQGFFLFLALVAFHQRRRQEFLELLHIQPTDENSRWYRICYPHGKRPSFTTTGNSTGQFAFSSSGNNPQVSNDRWDSQVSTAATFSMDKNSPLTHEGIDINPRRGSGDLDICVAGDLMMFNDDQNSKG